MIARELASQAQLVFIRSLPTRSDDELLKWHAVYETRMGFPSRRVFAAIEAELERRTS